MKDYNNVSMYELNQDMKTFFHAKAFDLVEYLLTSPELKTHADINHQHDYIFDHACMAGNLDFIKFIFNTPSLERTVTIKDSCIKGFNHCIQRDHLDLFQYFENKLEEINDDISAPFRISLMHDSCMYGSLNTFKYLSQEYLKTKEFDDNDYEKFSLGFKNRKNIKLIKYLIFDLNIPKTSHIEKQLKDNPLKDEVNKLFEQRDLNQDLHNELSTDVQANLNKRAKI